MSQQTQLSPDDLFLLIGKLYVEITALQARLAQYERERERERERVAQAPQENPAQTPAPRVARG